MSALGAKATVVFRTAAEIGARTGRGFDPVVLFLCALDAVDPGERVVPRAARDAALRRALDGPACDDASGESTFKDLVDAAFRQAALRGHPVVFPLDVIRACLDIAEPSVVAAFGDTDVRRAFRLEELEDIIPADVLHDAEVEIPSTSAAAASAAVPAFEVVVTGPGFCDRSNRYETLAEAQWAANSLSVRAFGSPLFPPVAPGQPSTIGIVVPPRLREATRIELREC